MGHRFSGLTRNVPLEQLLSRFLAVAETLTLEELKRVIEHADEVVARGEGGYAATTVGHPALSRLTPRERQIFEGAAKGASNREMARAFGTSKKTVETQRAAVNRKLGVRSPGALVRFAAKVGML